MSRSVLLAAALVCGCIETVDDTAPTEPTTAEAVQSLGGASITRENLADDVWHTTFTIPIGAGPNAILRLHRVVRERPSGLPRPTDGGVMLMHGDFSSIETNFIPPGGGMALYLAQQGLDVWGFDRRWATAPEAADLSDFGDMGVAQELGDTGTALATARAIRLVTGSGADKLVLAGFSRGGFLAYAYTSVEATRPSILRHVKGLVPLDVLYVFAPEDDVFRQKFCESAAAEFADLALGVVDSPNGLFVVLADLAVSAPDDPSPFPFTAGLTNYQAFLALAGQTYAFFTPQPFYHLAAATFDSAGLPAGLGFSSFDAIATWFGTATPHQSLREAAETDQMWCGEPPFAVDAPASRIRVPIFNLAAAGGYGHGTAYTLTQVSSTDVTSLVIQELPDEQIAEDFGHGDLLFADDAAALAWDPLAAWIRSH